MYGRPAGDTLGHVEVTSGLPVTFGEPYRVELDILTTGTEITKKGMIEHRKDIIEHFLGQIGRVNGGVDKAADKLGKETEDVGAVTMQPGTTPIAINLVAASDDIYLIQKIAFLMILTLDQVFICISTFRGDRTSGRNEVRAEKVTDRHHPLRPVHGQQSHERGRLDSLAIIICNLLKRAHEIGLKVCTFLTMVRTGDMVDNRLLELHGGRTRGGLNQL